jgi:hypothetical protein
MKATYLDQIENKITAHRQTIQALQHEIDKLQGAAEVIAQLRGNDGFETTKALDITPDRRTSQSYTIRKIGDGAPGRGARAAGGITGPEIRKRLEAALQANRNGMTLKDIGPAIGLPPDKKTANRIWYQLNELAKLGRIDKDGHTYMLKRAVEYEDG